MLPYNISFIFIFLMTFLIDKVPITLRNLSYLILFIFLLLFVGLRHEVGGDWFSYIWYIQDLKTYPEKIFTFRSDWGFNALLYLLFNVDYNIYIINSICAFLFISSIFLFAFNQNRPIIVLFIASPYIINVIGMGYTRQSVGYAFLIFSIFALKNNKNLYFIFLIVLGSLFHKSLILFLILYFVNYSFNFRSTIIMATLSIIVLVLFIYKLDTVQFYIYHYLGEGKHLSSKGTIFRYIINLIPALLILFFGTNFIKNKIEKRVILLFIIFTFAGLFFYKYAPTAFDRMGLYLTLIQLYFYSNLDLIVKNNLLRRFIYIFMYFFYFLINYVWLNFSTYKDEWLPYNILFYQFY